MRRRQRLKWRNFLPGAENLESRIAPSMDIGINVGPNLSNTGDPIWTDLHNEATSWTPLSGSSLALSTDGYPLADASVNFDTANYPAGNYEFSFTGSGTVMFSGTGQLTGPVTTSNGVTTGTVTVSQPVGAGSWLTMQVTGVDSTNPMADFHLMMPGYGDGTAPEPMFTPAFLQKLAPFSNIRFLTWDHGSNTTVSNWDQRVSPTNFTTDGPGGVPYEDMIELCNETQKDMWINVPALATPQFVQSLAQLIYTDLDSNLNVYVEYSNETWNPAFLQWSQVYSAAKLNPLVTQSSNGTQMVEQQTAYQEVSIAQIFEQTFGAESSRIRPIIAGQATVSSVANYALQFIQQTYGPPSQFIYATAEAPYVALYPKDNVAGLTLDQLFTDLNQYLSTGMTQALQADAAVAQQYGIPLISYEGGQGLVPGTNGVNYGVMLEAQSDPRMYQLYLSLMNTWQQVGGGLFDAFTLDGLNSGNSGFWAMLPNVLASGGQAYDALISLIQPDGDANLDGIVDYGDFQNLEANYGETGTYWQQGDFNDDGMVNSQDLNILRENLNSDGFTLSEFAELALFGQLNTVVPGESLEYDGYGVAYASDLPFAASSGTIKLDENSQGAPIVLSGAAYSKGLGMGANSSVSFTLNGEYSQFESTIGVDGTSDTGSSVVYDVYGDGQLLYESPTVTYASGAIPIDLNVAGVTTLSLVVSAAPGSQSSADHAVWADARLISTANFGPVQPYTLTWQLAQNGTVLSTQTTDSFVFGAISGTYTITLTVTDAQGDTATTNTSIVVTPANESASYFMTDSHTVGGWIGSYGSQGYDIIGGRSSLPNYATVTPSGQSTVIWATSTNAPAALEVDPGPFGSAAAWYSSTSFTVNINLTDGQTHDLTLYAVDWKTQNRSEQIQIINAATGAVLDSRSISSFNGGIYLQWAVSGNIEIVVTNLGGPNAVLSGLFFDTPTAGTTYVTKIDATTQGNWFGTYGTQAYDIVGNLASIPSYAGITTSGASTLLFSGFASTPQALEDAIGTGRVAAAWSASTSFTINVSLSDGQAHALTLYAVDWNNQGRVEQIQIIDPTTGTVLDTETLASFGGGVYLQWVISGSVEVQVTGVGASNAVISGVFLDPASLPAAPATASLIGSETTTKGSWIGTYGAQGYDVINSAANFPSYAIVTPVGQGSYTWTANTTDSRALQNAGGTGRIAACWYSTTGFNIDLDLTDSSVHDLALYFLDWDGNTRSEQVQIIAASGGTVLDTETVSSFHSGVYLKWTVSGNVVIKITSLSGPNAVLSGLFLDSPIRGTTYPSKVDAVTQGNWFGAYGTQAYDIVGNLASIPSYAGITTSGASTLLFSGFASTPQALEDAIGTGRVAAAWSASTSFTINVSLSDGQAHALTLYAVDWNNQGRVEQIQLIDPTTGAVLDTEKLAAFGGGIYYQWVISRSVAIKVTGVGASNAVISGVFLDPASPPVAPATGSLIGSDATTKGSWIGTYGAQGYDVINSAANFPSYAIVTPVGQGSYTWTANTTDSRALQNAGGTGRIAACWYSTTGFNIDLDLTDSSVHDLALYFLDWDGNTRSEQVQIIAASGGTVLDTETVSSFHSGVYLKWAVSGNVVIKITTLAGSNAVLSGFFLDAQSTSTTAVFSQTDTTTQGNWFGTYGTQAYDIVGNLASIPSYAGITTSGASTLLFSGFASTPQALEDAIGTGRVAAAWSASTSFTINVSLSDGQAHALTLYAVDWNNQGRVEQIQIIDPTTGTVLDTETLASFGGGVYLQWVISGSVEVQVTGVGASNAVISGVFLDPASLPAAPATASLIGSDTTTKGSWIGTYGGQGYDVINNAANLPSYAIVTPVGQGSYTWTANTTDSRALQNAGGTGRIAACWYSTTGFNIDLDLTDNAVHDLALYFLDWDGSTRSEQVQLVSALGGTVLDTETVSSFHSGVYLKWAVSGNVVIKITSLSGPNAVLSGLFLG